MSKRINLLFIVAKLQSSSGRSGGAEKHVLSLLNHLDREKFNMSLACLKDDQASMDRVKIPHLKRIFSCKVKHKIDLTVVSLLAQHIEDHQVDIVVCTNQYAMLYGLLAKRKSGYPSKVIDVFHSTLPSGWYDNLQWLLYRPLFKRCDHIVFVSENQSRYWLENRGMATRRHSVIHNGIDTERFTHYDLEHEKQQDLLKEYQIQPHALMIGICAVLRPEKKHADLIQAISQLRSEGVDAGLLIIGDGEERQKIIDKVAAFPSLEQSVYFVGFQQDVRPFVKLCHCMVIASHSIETFSISALESMALGKPMIMTDIGGASELISHGQNGFLYKPGDIGSLVEYLKELADPVRRKQFGAIAKKTVNEKFTLPRMIDKFETLFSDSL